MSARLGGSGNGPAGQRAGLRPGPASQATSPHTCLRGQRVVRRDHDVSGRRGLLLGVAAGALLVAAILALGRWLPRLPLFAVDVVEARLSGRERYLTRRTVLEAAAVRRGTPLLAVDLREVAERVRALPWVDGVVVRRELPSRLVVEVTERSAAALVQLDRLYFADAGGRVFKPVEPGEAADLPVITGLAPAELADDPGRSAARLAAGLALLELAAARLPVTISELHVDALRGFVLRTNAPGTEIVVGEGPFATKLDRAALVLAHLTAAGEDAESVDVTLEHRAIARRRPAAAPAKGRAGGKSTSHTKQPTGGRQL
jgi:cell division septal protein FtsQ